MLTLSIQQPWAWAICNAGKDIENRSWPTRVRGCFLIHAGKRIDSYGYTFLAARNIRPPLPKDIERGGIVGHANLVDCVTESDSPWFFGKYGFVLTDQRPLAFVPLKGQLGFFDADYKKMEE